jgi:hypothetical protein
VPVEELSSATVIDQLFPGDPLLAIALDKQKGATRLKTEWLDHLGPICQFIVPSPMIARVGKAQDGSLSYRAVSIVGDRRFLVVEADKGTLDHQARVLMHIGRNRLSLVVFSGGKSLHGWIYCHGQSEENVRKLRSYAVRLGADRAPITKNQLVRFPGGTRRENGAKQQILYFNPSAICD